MTATPGSHFFTADGIKFHYHISGTGPLVVIQSVGWGMPGHYLSNGIEKLTEAHTVIYFDPRGNGLSSRPADDNTMCSKFMHCTWIRRKVSYTCVKIDIAIISNS